MQTRPTRRTLATRGVAWITLAAFASTACGGRSTATSKPTGNPPDLVYVQVKDAPDGLDLRLSDGTPRGGAVPVTPAAPATPLPDADADKLLARAPAIKAAADDKLAFALRPRSLPPPRTGKVQQGVFPPAPGAPGSLSPPVPKTADAGKALTVLRYQPEGDVPLVPQLTVTFSQPMVAVTSQDDAARVQPVKLTPQPAGRWRWLGTKTIVFDPEIRFPQATTYQVEIPAGTTSATGNKLDKAVSFSFETPTPRVVTAWPQGDSQRRDVPMFIRFDQKIDPAAVLAKLSVRAGKQAVTLRQLADSEIAANASIKALVEQAKRDSAADRYIAFKATTEFPADTGVRVTIGAGTPSLEGPNTTPDAQTFDFRTYPPLRIEEADCGWGDECRPGYPFGFVFNNELDSEKFDDAMITVTPDLPGQQNIAEGSFLSVRGATAAQTTYKVTIAGGITDVFGQTLGKDQTFTFRVGDPEPSFAAPSGMLVLDPQAKKPTLDVFTTGYTNVKVELRSVTPADLPAFTKALERMWDTDNPPKLPGKQAFKGNVKVTSDKGKLVETGIELAAALPKSGLGHVIAVVEPHPWTERWDPPRSYAWIQVTKLGLDAYVDQDDLIAMVTELADGRPAKGVALTMNPGKVTGTSDDTGMAKLPLATAGKGSDLLLATRGDDTAILSGNGGYYYDDYAAWVKRPRNKNVAWYVTDDRKMYKPSEEVHLKGWLREIDYGKGGDVGGVAGMFTGLRYEVRDSQGNEILKGNAKISALGSFDLAFKLPPVTNLGQASVNLYAEGKATSSYWHSIQVQEFRRPEFEVSAKVESGVLVVGGGGDVTVEAKYFAGGGLAGAEANWYVNASPTNFTPPNRDEYTFGEWVPWWGWSRWWDDGDSYGGGSGSWSHRGKTDAVGKHVLHMDFLSAKPARPMSVTANASVMDVNRQAWNASANLLVHPSTLYVGVKTKRMYVDKGTPIDLGVIGVDLDGKAAIGTKMQVVAYREEVSWKKGKYVTEEKDRQVCDLVAAADEGACSFQTPAGGTYQIVATIVDGAGRPNQTKTTVWVTGGDVVPQRELRQEQVTLIPDKQTYAVGDTAELLVQAPFFPAEALVSWRRSGIVKTERISMKTASAVVKVPISESMIPDLTVQVDLVGAAVRADDKGDPAPSLPKRPAYASGAVSLSIPPTSRTLAVTVTPAAAKVDPGAQTSFDVVIKDALGKPVAGSEVALMVVDEAVLALTGFQHGNPIDAFYPGRGPGVSDHHSRGYVQLARADAGTMAAGRGGVTLTGSAVGDMADDGVAAGGAMPAAPPMEAEASPDAAATKSAPARSRSGAPGGGGGGNGAQPIAVRSDFNPLAAFSPTLSTDAAGRATLPVKMPDNLTRYRVMASPWPATSSSARARAR
jgi:hypothetical protein